MWLTTSKKLSIKMLYRNSTSKVGWKKRLKKPFTLLMSLDGAKIVNNIIKLVLR